MLPLISLNMRQRARASILCSGFTKLGGTSLHPAGAERGRESFNRFAAFVLRRQSPPWCLFCL
jgi:hypothetical protein